MRGHTQEHMTIPSYEAIRTELLTIRDRVRATNPNPIADSIRASELIGMLLAKGISPRRVKLSLRHLGLSPRQVARRG